jgi:hypothetical protein
MENAKHIGCMWALAVALGVGLAVANTPAVASAAPGDSGKGSSSGESSQSSPPDHSRSASPHTPSAKRQLTATNDAPKPRRRPPDPSDAAATSISTKISTKRPAAMRATPESTGTDVRKQGAAALPTVTDSSLDVTVAPVHSTAAVPAIASPARTSVGIATSPADPVPRIVSTVVNAVLSPFAGSAPSEPGQTPAAFTLLAFARREFEPSTTVDQPAAAVTTSAVDPDFISSTHKLGPFSVTSAADPDDDHYVAFVLSTPFFTNVLTSGTDPEDNLGFGAASIGVAGHTVNTFISPFLNFSVAIPITDPLAPLFTALVRAGF